MKKSNKILFFALFLLSITFIFKTFESKAAIFGYYGKIVTSNGQTCCKYAIFKSECKREGGLNWCI